MLSKTHQAFALPRTVTVDEQEITIAPLTMRDLIAIQDKAVARLKAKGEMKPVETYEEKIALAAQIDEEIQSLSGILDTVFASLKKNDPELTEDILVEALTTNAILELYTEIQDLTYNLSSDTAKNQPAPEKTARKKSTSRRTESQTPAG